MIRRLAITLILLGNAIAADSQTMTSGTVTRIHDGDSLVIALSGTRSIEVRLAEIDAPEKQQPCSDHAKTALEDLLQDQQVSIELYDIDRYGRAVARIWRADDGLYINAWMVRNGYAWVYPRYAEDPVLADLQQQAMSEGLGFWQLPVSDRIPPWQWREAARD